MRRYILVRLAQLSLLVLVLYFYPMASMIALPGDAAVRPSKEKVEQWIENLGSDRFEIREAATKALMDLEDEPLALRPRLKSHDLEVRRRAARVLEAYVPKRARRGLAKAWDLAKENRVDEMSERLIMWKEWISKEEEWRTVAKLIARLVEWENRTFNKTRLFEEWLSMPIVSFKDKFFPENSIIPAKIEDMWTCCHHLLGQEVTLDTFEVQMAHIVILASEKIRTPLISGNVIISGGGIQIQKWANHSIIICDAELELNSSIRNCLVIARGNIKCNKDIKIYSSTILCGGSFTCEGSVSMEKTAILSGGPIVCPKSVTLRNQSMLNECLPEIPVKLFDPKAMGLTVWQLYRNNGALTKAPILVPLPDGGQIIDRNGQPILGDGVWIEDVRKGTPFATGLRHGDIITAIDEMKTPTKAVFRKVLRRKLAEGRPIAFTVQRAAKTLEVPIPVKD